VTIAIAAVTATTIVTAAEALTIGGAMTTGNENLWTTAGLNWTPTMDRRVATMTVVAGRVREAEDQDPPGRPVTGGARFMKTRRKSTERHTWA
jgi:hypothetical protein